MSEPTNELAQLIRAVDGNNDLGAGALAEKLIERGVQPPKSRGYGSGFDDGMSRAVTIAEEALKGKEPGSPPIMMLELLNGIARLRSDAALSGKRGELLSLAVVTLHRVLKADDLEECCGIADWFLTTRAPQLGEVNQPSYLPQRSAPATPDYPGIKAENLAELAVMGTYYPGALDELVRRAKTSPLRPDHERPVPDAAPRWYRQDERMPDIDTWVNVALTEGWVTVMKYSPAWQPEHNPEMCWEVHGMRYSRAEVAYWMPLPAHPDRRTP